jgi:hypothetical protein
VTWPNGRKQVLEHVMVNQRRPVIQPRQ